MIPKTSWSEFILAMVIAAAALVAVMVIPKSQTISAAGYPIFQPMLPLVY
jgi:hypothetical protein